MQTHFGVMTLMLLRLLRRAQQKQLEEQKNIKMDTMTHRQNCAFI